MTSPAPTLERQPALDGVRAVAVVMVLLFHLGTPWTSGGYLGVSLFFTLSGFLITSLLLKEQMHTGSIRLGRFYLRRLRRLIPASMATLLAVTVLAAVGVFDTSARLRSEITAAGFQVLNWYELVRGTSYADLFVAASPVAHFWSLGIEEQFYWLWPVIVLWFCARRRRSGRDVVVPISVAWLLTSLSAPVTAIAWSPAAAYYASWARASEILAGAALAALLVHRRVRPGWRFLAPAALAAILVSGALVPAGRGIAYQGGLPLFGLVSTALIAGLQVPDGATTRLLSRRPVVALGAISYGVYLYHWPVIIALDEQRTGLSGLTLGSLRVAVTLAVATASYHLLERPIRSGHRPQRPSSAVVLSALGAVGIAAASFVVLDVPTPPAVAPPVLTAAPGTTAATSAPTNGSGAPSTPSTEPSTEPVTTPTTAVSPATVVAMFGDSVPAWLLRDAAASYDRSDVAILNGAHEACDAMVDLPVGRDRRGDELRPPAECLEWPESYPPVLTGDLRPDVALLVLGQAPSVDHLVDGEWRGPCDTTQWYLDDLAARIDYIRSLDLPVVFALPARPGIKARFILPDDSVERFECIRRDLRELLGEIDVPIVDLDEVLCPDDDCERLRTTDGVHVDAASAPAVLDWVIDATLRAADTDPL